MCLKNYLAKIKLTTAEINIKSAKEELIYNNISAIMRYL